MVSLNFNDFYFFLSPLLLITGIWFFFFRLNTSLVRVNTKDTTNITPNKINSNNSFIYLYFYITIFSTFNIYTIHGKNIIVWFNHFFLNNFTINLLFLFTLISYTLFLLIKFNTKKNNLFKSLDYLFSLNNLVLLLPYLFFTNTIFTFLFLLELISATLLYKLISSKIWFKNSNKDKVVSNNIPQNYLNMVFFQYWITFFSTIFIIYFYINIFYIYGTSEWSILEFLNRLDLELSYTNSTFLRILIIVFLSSIILKLGITPFHLYKIEVYKGIPLLSIFFYTTYYFSIFFIFFTYVLSDLLSCFVIQYYIFLVFILLFGMLYVTILLFDVNFLKAFFAYSTVINTIGFLIIFISTL